MSKASKVWSAADYEQFIIYIATNPRAVVGDYCSKGTAEISARFCQTNGELPLALCGSGSRGAGNRIVLQ